MSQHQDLQLKVANEAADSDADNAEPLTPRYSLTANKCKNNGSEQHFHLMLFGGMSDDSMIADTTLGKHSYTPQQNITLSLMNSLALVINAHS